MDGTDSHCGGTVDVFRCQKAMLRQMTDCHRQREDQDSDVLSPSATAGAPNRSSPD